MSPMSGVRWTPSESRNRTPPAISVANATRRKRGCGQPRYNGLNNSTINIAVWCMMAGFGQPIIGIPVNRNIIP